MLYGFMVSSPADVCVINPVSKSEIIGVIVRSLPVAFNKNTDGILKSSVDKFLDHFNFL